MRREVQLEVWSVGIIATLLLQPRMDSVFCDDCIYEPLPRGQYANCSDQNRQDIPNSLHNDTVVLDLSKNNITKVPNNSFANLPKLEGLNLSRNHIDYLGQNAFCGLNRLQILKLSHNLILITEETFGPNIFSPLEDLRELYLDNNIVNVNSTYLDTAVGKCLNLERLYIQGLSNKTFGSGYANLRNLTHLSLSVRDNSMSIIGSDTFNHTIYLQQLEMIKCGITRLDMCTFCPLLRLNYLDMSGNSPNGLKLARNVTYGLQFTNITTVKFSNMEDPHGMGKYVNTSDLEFSKNTSTKYLDVSGNMIEVLDYGLIDNLPPDLEELDVSDNRPVLGPYLFQIGQLKKLRVFRADKLNNYHPLRIRKKRNAAESSDLLPTPKLKLPPNLQEFYCSNSMIPYDIIEIKVDRNNSLRRIVMRHNAMSRWIGPLRGLDKLTHLDLSVNLCDNISDSFFINLTSLTSLRLRANFIGYVIEGNKKCPWLKPLTKLVTLDLYLNKIRVIPADCFLTLVNLEVLNLTDNSLTDWLVEIGHMPNISVIDLTGNSIDRFPKRTRDHLSDVAKRRNVTVNLTGNLLECTCENIEFLEWFYTADIIFTNKEKYTCRDRHWKELKMTDLKQMISDLKKSCFDFSFLNSVLSVLIGCFLLACLHGMYFRYKWKLSYIYYTTFGRYQLLNDEDEETYRYDAFVSYSEDDQDFAENELAEKLETLHGLSLYLYERDCRAGHSINATIVNKIENSRKTIIVFTKSYIKNRRCLFEFNMASMKQMYRKGASQSIYLIHMESVPHKDIPLDILKLFESDSYIEYPHDPQGNTVFWKRLKSTIKPSLEIV